jgi:hypothetical protein
MLLKTAMLHAFAVFGTSALALAPFAWLLPTSSLGCRRRYGIAGGTTIAT